MRNAIPILVCGAITTVGAIRPVTAQLAVPVVTLPAATAKTAETVGVVLGIRELANGKLLVNDAGRRQIKLFDSTLAAATIVMDSVAGMSRSYGARPAPLVAYLSDSTLLPDYGARVMRVLDGNGQFARAIALPTLGDIGLIRRGTGVDAAGRVLYLGSALKTPAMPGAAAEMADSVPILRADLDRRRTDTLGHVARPLEKSSALAPDGSATISVWTVDPLRTLDEWAVLSDGSVALVRGHDYHIDWIHPNGATATTSKLPFDWRQLSDDDKRRIVDSTRAQLSASIANGTIVNQADMVTVVKNPDGMSVSGASPASGRGGRGFAGFRLQPSEPLPLDKIADYYPPLRTGAAMPDADGNLWILPTTSKQSMQGELVYDVVNAKGELFERVRAPLGRLIIGFGKGGAIYMVAGDRTNGFYLERTKLPKAPFTRQPGESHRDD